MPLLLGSQDLSPASLTEYSARALSPDSVYALTLDEASRDGIRRASSDSGQGGGRVTAGIWNQYRRGIIVQHACTLG